MILDVSCASGVSISSLVGVFQRVCARFRYILCDGGIVGRSPICGHNILASSVFALIEISRL